MNAYYIRAVAACWLRYDRQCPVIAFERGLRATDRPDILAITKDRFLLEIEIKVAMGDFRADAGKRKHLLRKHGVGTAPALFYFAVPPDMVEKAKRELPPGAGLLTLLPGWKRNPRRMNPYTGLPDATCVVAPRRQAEARRVSIEDTIEMVRNQSGTLVSMACVQAKRIASA